MTGPNPKEVVMRASRFDGAERGASAAHASSGTRRFAAVGAAVVAGGLLAAACGSPSGYRHQPAASPSGYRHQPAASASGQAAPGRPVPVTVRAGRVADLGAILVGSTGQALYMFSPDHHKTVTCTSSGGCATEWPPLELAGPASSAQPGPGVRASLLGVIQAPDGHLQVTYNHWPLYSFAGDTVLGKAEGQGLETFGGRWSSLTPAGLAPSTRAEGSEAPHSNSPYPKVGSTAPTSTTGDGYASAPPATQPSPPATQPSPPTTSGIPQGNGGDGDGDNNGAQSDGDGDI